MLGQQANETEFITQQLRSLWKQKKHKQYKYTQGQAVLRAKETKKQRQGPRECRLGVVKKGFIHVVILEERPGASEGGSPESTWRDNATGQRKGPKAEGCLVCLQTFTEAHVVKESKQEAE